MAFLKNLGGSLANLAGSAADKAKKMAEIARLNSAIGGQEKLIKEAYLEIGKIMFEHEKDKLDSIVAEWCGKITLAQQEIEDLKVKIAEQKDEEKPEVAHTPEPASALTTSRRKFCNNCGAENSDVSKFCNSCGQAMKN
ncbi:MAG: zinc ribbon domain-containing protein [bacterium]|nr:zinc ribbon domain-containing protein [bacterium]